jgi:hypothetical protein
MNAHPTEYRERFDKVLVVLRERQIVEFIDQLNDTDYLPGGILDGHTKDRVMLEAGAIVHQWVESRVIVGVWYINSLKMAFMSSRAIMFSPSCRQRDALMLYKQYSLHQSSLRNP